MLEIKARFAWPHIVWLNTWFYGNKIQHSVHILNENFQENYLINIIDNQMKANKKNVFEIS